MSTTKPAKYPRLRRIRITKSRKPDLFTADGKHYFINGVVRNEHFSHITPMTEEQTEAFFADWKSMPRDEVHAKWAEFAIEKTEETETAIHGPKEGQAGNQTQREHQSSPPNGDGLPASVIDRERRIVEE